MKRFIKTMTIATKTMFIVRHDSDAKVVEVIRWDADGSPAVVDSVSYMSKEDAAVNPNSVQLSAATDSAVSIMTRRYWDEIKKRQKATGLAV